MRRRLPGAMVALAAGAMLTGCAPLVPVCPAIGFVNRGPVVIEVAPALAAATVAACIGDGCTPAALPLDGDGRGQMSPEPPYVRGTGLVSIDPGTNVRVVITGTDGVVVRDREIEIPYRSEGGSCPGPVSFQPVVVS